MGEGIFLHLAEEAGLSEGYGVDSAGTSAYHVGERPDRRGEAVATRHGVSLPSRSRQVQDEDFTRFDVIIAMDRENLRDLEARCPPARRQVLRLMRSLDPEGGEDVPDPYYGGPGGFDDMYAMLLRCCQALLKELEQGA